MSRVSRARSVIAIADQLRGTHPELTGPVRWPELQQLLAREEIRVVRAPIKARAYVDGADGTVVITMRAGLDPRLHTRVLLHEYAHAKLHLTERGEVVRQLMPCLTGDPREDEANLFALLLWLGPTATPEHPDVARLVAALETRQLLARRPAQFDLELPPARPLPAPTYRPPPALPAPFDDERAYELRIAKRGAATLRVLKTGPTREDFDRILFHDPARGVARFTDLAGRRWWIYNYRTVITPTVGDAAGSGRREWIEVRDFMSREIQYRVFVNSVGARRIYRFPNRRERRIYRASMLDRQLAHAVVIPRPTLVARRAAVAAKRGVTR